MDDTCEVYGASAVKTVQPETRYARLGEDRLAYQVLGQGPPDLVLTIGSLGSIDLAWEEPGAALFLRRLASFSRLILFDRLGVGNSDPRPLDPLSPWESYAEELVAILDEVGSERTAIMAHLDAGPMALFFAATRPERTRGVSRMARWCDSGGPWDEQISRTRSGSGCGRCCRQLTGGVAAGVTTAR
jgi:pimeloyl-ACP methyl ester carboxylesterase